MWPFKKSSAQDEQWEAQLQTCNFPLACHELATFLEQGNREAAGKGGEYIYKEDFVKGWERFAANPCHETAIRLLRDAPDYSKLLLQSVFLPSCPGGMFYSLNEMKNRSAGFPPSVYPFDSEVCDIVGLSELSETEYQAFPRSFRLEVIYNAPELSFLKRDWKVMIGAVNGNIYNVAASHDEGGTPEVATNYLNEVIAYCSYELGLHTERQAGAIVWDTTKGSVMIQFAPIMGSLSINLFSTSKAIKGFARK